MRVLLQISFVSKGSNSKRWFFSCVTEANYIINSVDINNFALNISLTRYSLATYFIGEKIPNVSPVDGIFRCKVTVC